jgi:hypothetical protein
MGEKRNAYRILVGKPEGKRHLVYGTERIGSTQALVFRVKCASPAVCGTIEIIGFSIKT